MSNARSWSGSAETHFSNAETMANDPSQRELAHGLKDLAYALTMLDRSIDEMKQLMNQARR